MAFWGPPTGHEGDEANACAAALQCLAALEGINREFRAEGHPEISVRVGLHSGDVIAGNLGSDRLFDFTVVGDTVNTASRLESANKVFNTKIMVSEETLKSAAGAFAVRELGLIEVKGKTLPLRIYELLGLKGDRQNPAERLLEQFNRGLDLFRQRQWKEAEESFDSALAILPDDGPSIFYRERARECLAGSGLTENPDIIKMKEK